MASEVVKSMQLENGDKETHILPPERFKDKPEVDSDSQLDLERIATEDYPGPLKLAFTTVALAFCIFIVALDLTIVSTAIPRITDEFHSLAQVGWYGSGFFLTFGSFQSTWGKVYKYFPLKTSFLVAVSIFEIGSLICAVAQSSTTLIVGRAIAGLGAAGVASGVYTIIAFSVPPKKRAAFTGLIGAVFGTASVVGPLLGGVFTDHLSWRWCFYINLPIGGLAAGIVLFIFTTPAAARPVKASITEKFLQMDFLGTFTIMAGVVCYILALQWGGVTKPWSDSTVIGTLVGFVLLAIVFVVIEYHLGDRALLQGRLLKRRVIGVVATYMFFFSGPFFTLLYYLPIYFQSIKGVSAAHSGINSLPLVMGASLFSIVSGVLITVFGYYTPIMVFSSVVATVGAGLIYTFQIDTPAHTWIGYQSLAGIGIGLGFQIPVIVAQSSVAASDISSATAVLLFFQSMGGTFYVSAGQSAFANRLVAFVPKYAPGVDPRLVLATGAAQLRDVFDADVLPGVLQAYMKGIKITFALCIAMAGITLPIALLSPWRKLHGGLAAGGAAA